MRKINAQQSQDAIQSKHKIIEKIVSGQAELSKKKKKKSRRKTKGRGIRHSKVLRKLACDSNFWLAG